MDWRALAKDRRVQIGAAGAVALGGIAWYRKRQVGGSNSATTTTGGGAAASGSYQGTGDTTGTDIAGWQASQNQAQLDALNSWTSNLNDTLQTFKDSLTQGTSQASPSTPATGGTPTTPAPTTPAPTAHRTVPVAKYTKYRPAWNSTLSGIAKHEKTTVSNLLKLNPGIKNPNVIHAGQQIRVS